MISGGTRRYPGEQLAFGNKPSRIEEIAAQFATMGERSCDMEISPGNLDGLIGRRIQFFGQTINFRIETYPLVLVQNRNQSVLSIVRPNRLRCALKNLPMGPFSARTGRCRWRHPMFSYFGLCRARTEYGRSMSGSDMGIAVRFEPFTENAMANGHLEERPMKKKDCTSTVTEDEK